MTLIQFKDIPVGTIFSLGGFKYKKVSETEYRRFCSYNRSLIIMNPNKIVEV
jgi:hypothetical protein